MVMAKTLLRPLSLQDALINIGGPQKWESVNGKVFTYDLDLSEGGVHSHTKRDLDVEASPE